MAKLTSGVLGPFTGRLGTAVGYSWKHRACVRSYRPHINFPNTPLQQQQHSWFISMVRFAAAANDALKLGFKQRSDESVMTEGNYFVASNKEHFHVEDGKVTVDYEKLQISAGAAADVYFKQPHFGENETLSVEFDKNSLSLRASGEDKVYLFVYSPARDEGVLSAPAARRTKEVRVSLPEDWTGCEVHLYGFVVDKEGRASNSTYIGVGRVNHYEERGRYIPVDNHWQEFVDLANGSSSAERREKPVDKAVATSEEPRGEAETDPPGIP